MYNNNELSERESKKRTPSKIALEKKIYIYIPRNKLNQEDERPTL